MRQFPNKTLLISFFLSLILTPRLTAQPQFLENGASLRRGLDDGFLSESATRTRIDLNGPWTFEIPEQGGGTVRLPAVYDHTGEVLFERSVEIDPQILRFRQYHLVMFGVNHTCEVTVNGEFFLSHSGGFTSFSQPIPQNLLQPGKDNLIRVSVNNELDRKKTLPLRPPVWSWRNFGGIHREVFLLTTPALYLKDVAVTSEINEALTSARVVVRSSLEGKLEADTGYAGSLNPMEGLAFGFELVEVSSGLPVGRSPLVPLVMGREGWNDVTAEYSVVNPHLWRLESPDLYTVRAFIVQPAGIELRLIDEVQLLTGIRRLVISRGDLLLNGKRLILKGVIWNQDHPQYGMALPYEELEKDVILIRNMGANAIRFEGRPPHPAMLTLCDRLGVLALEELPLSQTPAPVLMAEQYQELAVTMAREMVIRDRHHPSVLAWGIGDENQSFVPGVRPFAEAVVGTIRALDSRPVYYSALPRNDDTFLALADIAAITIDEATDLKVLKTHLEEWRTANKGKPVIVGRLGKEVDQANRNGYADPLSQQAQARFFLQRLDLIRSLDYDGAVVWAFNDWKGARPSLTVHTGDPWLYSVGLVGRARDRRIAYEAVRSAFAGEKFTALQMGTYSSGAPLVYVLSGFLVLLAVAYLYNANRRFRECILRSMLNSYNFFADVRDQRLVSGVHSTLLALMTSVAVAIVASSVLYHFRGSWLLDNLLTVLLVYDGLKAWLVRLVWSPLTFILVFSGILFAGMFIIAGVIMLLRTVFKARVFSYHAFSIVTWSSPPLLFLIPIGMILYRVMESSVYILPALLVVVVLHLWVLLRMLKGISIVFDVPRMRVYLLAGLVLSALLTVFYVYYDVTAGAPMYVSFMYDVVVNAR